MSQQLIKCVSNLYPFKRIWNDKEKEDISNHLMYNGYDVFSCNLISFEFLFGSKKLCIEQKQTERQHQTTTSTTTTTRYKTICDRNK